MTNRIIQINWPNIFIKVVHSPPCSVIDPLPTIEECARVLYTQLFSLYFVFELSDLDQP